MPKTHGDLMVSLQKSGLSSPGLNPGQDHCAGNLKGGGE